MSWQATQHGLELGAQPGQAGVRVIWPVHGDQTMSGWMSSLYFAVCSKYVDGRKKKKKHTFSWSPVKCEGNMHPKRWIWGPQSWISSWIDSRGSFRIWKSVLQYRVLLTSDERSSCYLLTMVSQRMAPHAKTLLVEAVDDRWETKWVIWQVVINAKDTTSCFMICQWILCRLDIIDILVYLCICVCNCGYSYIHMFKSIPELLKLLPKDTLGWNRICKVDNPWKSNLWNKIRCSSSSLDPHALANMGILSWAKIYQVVDSCG